MAVNYRLLDKLRKRGLSLRACAKASKVPITTVWNALQGNKPKIDTCQKLATFFGVSVADLWPQKD